MSDENRETDRYEGAEGSSRWNVNRGLVILSALTLIGAIVALVYGFHQQSLVGQLSSNAEQMNATVGQLRGQVDSLTAKLSDVAAQQAAAAAAASANGTGAAGGKQAAGRRRADDKRLKQLQTRLDEQQKQLKDTQDQVSQTRTDLEGSISSTRDELNGSIAKTHEELVTLQKRGERNYFEFDMVKSKQFQRLGPLMLSLRRTDTKHKTFNLVMVVDDNMLSKNHVNLYEPIWIHRADDPQPVQVVINKIERNVVHGYVSAPKYRNSEISATVQPVSATTPAQSPTPNAPSNPPATPEQPPR